MNCPQCGGDGVPLGSLGSLQHYRCRDCGWNFSMFPPAVSGDDDDPEDR